MNWNYENYLLSALLDIQNDFQELRDFSFIVETEQIFAKRKSMSEKSIYIVIKYLTDDKQFGATTQPIQMLILSEQDSLDATKLIFSRFTNDYNWKVEYPDGGYVKQQYSEPVVLSNFEPEAYGFRSVMYVSGTLTIMENVLDVKQVILDKGTENEQILDCVTFTMSYAMQTNTQQVKPDRIAKSVKTVSNLTVNFTVPFQKGNIVNRFLSIIKETATGNEPFSLTFEINGEYITRDMRLISAQLNTAINQVPGLQLGFIK